jgi:predicted RNA binding protein YcfA (HicA-like mRNA interferase family)
MADRTLKLRRLIQILKAFGVNSDSKRGKGSHMIFYKRIDGATVTYPIPTSSKDVLICYIRSCRKKFKLTEDDGVSDHDFYNA